MAQAPGRSGKISDSRAAGRENTLSVPVRWNTNEFRQRLLIISSEIEIPMNKLFRYVYNLQDKAYWNLEMFSMVPINYTKAESILENFTCV